MRISTVNKAIRIYWKIWSVCTFILSLFFLVYGIKTYLNEPEIIKVQTVISTNKDIFSIKSDDKVSFGGKIWDVYNVYRGNDEDYYSITLTNSK